MKNRTVVSYLSALAGTMILLTACGGGGGVSSSGGGGDGNAAAPGGGGTVAGVAAKGILANAIVTAYCGNSEATADQLATGVTNAAGEYSLSWTIACDKPVLLVVTPGANTTMADEATGTTVAPAAGFALRALLADPGTTTIKNITPLTDMAAAIAGTSATLSKEAASNAETAVINTVLGGDIGAYQATPVAPTDAALANASADEKKLATLLTAISAFAQDDAVCKAKFNDAARIQCAIGAFAAQAAATVTGVSDTGYTVNTTVPARTPATMLADTLAKIQAEAASGTTGGIITAAGPQALSSIITSDSSGSAVLLMSANASVVAAANAGGFVAVSASYGIQAARDLFNSLKTDLLALSDGSGTGYLDQKVSAMNADWTSTGMSTATGFQKNLDALKRALEFAHAAKEAPFPAPTGTLLANTVYAFGGFALETDSTGAPDRYLRSYPDGMNCYVKVSDLTLGKAGCYYGYGQPNVPSTPPFTGYFHGVDVAYTNTADGVETYAWQDYLASRTYTAVLYDIVDPYGNPSFYFINGNGKLVRTATPTVVTSTKQTGTVTANLSLTAAAAPTCAPWPSCAPSVSPWTSQLTNFDATITAMTIQGNIQPLVAGQDYSTLDISGTSSSISGSSQVAEISGTVTNVAGGATTLSMALGSGTQVVSSTVSTPTSSDHPISAKLIVQVKTTAFQYDGTFTANRVTANAIGEYEPTNARFSGKISTLANGAATEFLSGTLGATISNMATYNPHLPTSSTNFLKGTVTFGGKATNGSKIYEMTFIADRSTYGQESVTLNYSRAGSQMVSVTGTHTDATDTSVLSIMGTGDINAVLTNGIGDVYAGTTPVGSVSNNPNQLNFTDGTYLLLGI